MDTNANIITTMGIISDEVYKEKYFNEETKELKANGTIYEVIAHTGDSTLEEKGSELNF